MHKVTFITGNQKKADYLAKYLGFPVEHVKVDVDELQSLDLHEIVRHKVRQAYAHVQGPVLVEDVSLEFEEFGKLPGPFIKYFLEELGLEKLCRMLDGKSRNATGRCVFGYYDGTEEKYFEGVSPGTIAQSPSVADAFGFDFIFIPQGYSVTRAEMSEEDDKTTYMQLKPFAKVKEFLLTK